MKNKKILLSVFVFVLFTLIGAANLSFAAADKSFSLEKDLPFVKKVNNVIQSISNIFSNHRDLSNAALTADAIKALKDALSQLSAALENINKNNGSSSSELSYAKGELLLKFKTGVPLNEEGDFLNKNGLRVKKEIDKIKVKVISVPEGAEEGLAEALSNNPKIDFSEVNKIIPPTFIPNDPQYPSEWHHSKINSPLAWDSVNGSSTTIAILDTGVDCTHPDLETNCVSGWNIVSNNSDTSDIHGHGTWVAGTAAAIGNNNNQVAGEAYAAKIMPIRITNDSVGGYAYWSDIANGIVYAADHGAKIASNSYASSESSSVRSAAQYMKNKGGLVTVAAGNTGALTGIGDIPEIIVVSATDQNDLKASFSSYGNNIDASAPGVSILTTSKGGGLSYVSGTSFATPLTAGTLALIWSINSGFTPDQVESILFNSSYDLGTVGWDNYYGWGRIDAGAAVALAKNTAASSNDTTAPTVSIISPLNGDTLSGSVNISVSAIDNVGVAKVELWKNGALFNTDTLSPYSFLWDTTKDVNGSYALQAKAYDSAGNIGTSSLISVNINNTADTIPPTITITAPANGYKLPSKSTTLISVSASDNIGIKEIDILFDNVLKNSCYNLTNCSYKLNSRQVSYGSHIISAKAFDAAENISTASITVTK